jgi:hypothetical protein
MLEESKCLIIYLHSRLPISGESPREEYRSSARKTGLPERFASVVHGQFQRMRKSPLMREKRKSMQDGIMLNKIRELKRDSQINKKIAHSIEILIAGLTLGVSIKLFDIYTNHLGNIFSEISVWILLGTVIAVFSSTPKRAGINVFLFCIGMLVTYYLTAELTGSVYSWAFIYGWSVFSLCSPLFAYITWYAKGHGWVAKLLSTGIIFIMLTASLILFDKVRLSDIIIAILTAIVLFTGKPDVSI